MSLATRRRAAVSGAAEEAPYSERRFAVSAFRRLGGRAAGNHHSVACGHQKSASVQPHRYTRQSKNGALRRTAQSMVYACRLALVVLKELQMECGAAFAATNGLLKFARRSITWVPTRAARLARSTSSAAAAVSVGIPWEALCAAVGWTRAAVAARHARSGTAAAASLPLHP
ncbi:hypothetical protein Emag_004168 [Eimeria magna]